MIHVWERRAGGNDAQTWLTNHWGNEQGDMDRQFIMQGAGLTGDMLAAFGGSVANNFNGFFPKDTTTITVIAPAANPDYHQDDLISEFINGYEPDFASMPPVPAAPEDWNAWLQANGIGNEYFNLPHNPFYLEDAFRGAPQNNGLRLYYQAAAQGLRDELVGMIIPGRGGQQSGLKSYRRRYGSDPMHKRDDRHIMAVQPYVYNNGEVWSVLYYDDDKVWPVARIA